MISDDELWLIVFIQSLSVTLNILRQIGRGLFNLLLL